MKRILSILLALLTLSLTVLTAVPTVWATASDFTYSGTAIAPHTGGYDHYDYTLVTHQYDFSMDRIGHYVIDNALAIADRGGADLQNERLTTRDGMNFTFGSAVTIGDDYGTQEGYIRFDLQLNAGKVLLGTRTARKACKETDRGIWFIFNGPDKLGIRDPESGLVAAIPSSVSFSEVQTVTLHEGLDTLTLSVGDTVLASVKCGADGYLAFCDGSGETVADTEKANVDPVGHFQLTLQDIDGYVDNVVFTHVEGERKVAEVDGLRLIDYSTWTATDALDRTVADGQVAGAPKDNRYVGLFYFLCSVGAGLVVSDNTKDWLTYGADGIKQRIEERAGEAYWAEPYFGYYINTDTWVYRKHAYMLEEAGVDFVFLDVSNGVVFPEGHTALFDTWLEMRREGTDTPQIVFFNGDTPQFMTSNMRQLRNTVYSDENWEKYEELFFMWEGKPLLFGNMSETTGELKNWINDNFTVRGSWAWQDKNNYWSWIQEYIGKSNRYRLVNGGWGRDSEGNYESLSIAMGHHPTMNKGRSFVNGVQPNNRQGDFEFSSIERAGLGLGFEAQFNAVSALIDQNVPAEDPFVLMITGWNEWIAGGFTNENPVPLANTTCKVQYVDQFNAEFSRDGEPMRNQDGYGIGDNYYYQMVDYIRRYKGISETPVADHQGSINIYDLSSWDSIELTYMDNLYDTELRNTVCYDASYRYINSTGRNDFASAKVSQDEHALYFLVTTAHDIVVDDGKNWMNLLINTDGNASTGWEGFDYILNRDRDSFAVTVEKFKDNTFESEVVGGAYYYLEGDSMAIRVSKDILGLSGKTENLIFKWADNSVENGDPMGFMDLGDTAPDNRFGYAYLCEDYTTSDLPEVTFDMADQTLTVKEMSVPKPEGDIHITIRDITVDTLFDLKNFSSGEMVADTAMGTYFEHAAGSNQSRAQVVVEGDRRFIRLNGYSDLRTWNDVEGSYEFSADIHMLEYGNSAVYVRGEMPGAYAPTNPRNFNIAQVFNYYEWDWYAENGGKTHGGSSTAGSGIGIYPDENSITIRIKRYAEDGLGVASASYTFPYSEGFRPDEDGWFKLRCVDDGSLLSIYFNDVLMCSAKLENPGVIYESDGTAQEYYGKVTLRTAADEEVLTVENTRVNSSGSQIALTTRMQTMEFGNIYIAYGTQEAEGSRLTAELTSVATEITVQSDNRLLTTLNFGETPAIDTESDTTDTEGTLSDSEDDSISESAVSEEGCRSVLLSAILPVILGGAALGFVKRRQR